ncbi:hypothetical protein [Arthrobacter sp. AZCC_0090]|uniref:hypothetical protein n=1 Tax=Arthrobacter sp. AZCC_0090 TaxID=2735881 RepID=UPI00161F1401|nr:hypothetical protein [Arthrobacter sp. AZCC_0090]MBB6405452.1 hypothetical protein [Arthrobacter sp. AZCC_0090]
MTLWKEKFFLRKLALELGKHSPSHVDQKYFDPPLIHRPIRSIHATDSTQTAQSRINMPKM